MTVVIYTYLSHKVPWLLLHILLPFTIPSAMFLNKLIENKAKYAVFVIIAITLVISVNLNFINYENDREGLVYVQTKSETLELVELLKNALQKGEDVKISEPESDYWPLPWYLRDYDVSYSTKIPERFEGILVVSERNVKTAVEKFGVTPSYMFEIRPGHFLYVIELR